MKAPEPTPFPAQEYLDSGQANSRSMAKRLKAQGVPVTRPIGDCRRCAQCGATGRIPERPCANRHLICSKCWWGHESNNQTDCPACQGLLAEGIGHER